MRPSLTEYYETLRTRFGHRGWWPGNSPFEIMVGAILTQNTSWSGAERALHNLRSQGWISPAALDPVPLPLLEQALRPAGTFRIKARRLKIFVRWFQSRYGGDVERMRSIPPSLLREQLLELSGIGPETADVILLYALGHPTFVVDRYTHRVFHRHGLVPGEFSYDELKDWVEGKLPRELDLFQDFHAQIVEVGKRFCRPNPECENCPLRPYLPEELS